MAAPIRSDFCTFDREFGTILEIGHLLVLVQPEFELDGTGWEKKARGGEGGGGGWHFQQPGRTAPRGGAERRSVGCVVGRLHGMGR